MLDKQVEEALNNQINAEFFSAYLYLSMSAWLESRGFPGFSHWMRQQWYEETLHAERIFEFINGRNGKVLLAPIEQVDTEFDSVLQLFQQTLEHEQKVTQRINELMFLGQEKKDFATQSFLQWFIDEQVEEEATVSQILDKLALIGNDGNGLFILDKEMATRPRPAIPVGNKADNEN